MPIKNEISEKENMLLCIEGKKPAWLPSFYDACSIVGPPSLGRKTDPQTGYITDIFGVDFTTTEDGPVPVSNLTQEHLLRDITSWRNVLPDIDLSKIDWEADAALIRSRVPDDKLIVYGGGPVWEQLHYMMGFEAALMSLLIEPDAVSECLNALADFWIDALRRMCRYLKPDMVVFAEHMATAKGPLMSPATYREIIKPVHKRMFGAALELGAITEIHCDGYIEPLLPDFVEIGVMSLQPFQVFNDINRLKEEYKITAFGGWDCFGRGNQPGATEDEVRASVRLAMDSYSPGYRYAFLQAGSTPRYAQNLEWLADEARTYGRTFYK